MLQADMGAVSAYGQIGAVIHIHNDLWGGLFEVASNDLWASNDLFQ